MTVAAKKPSFEPKIVHAYRRGAHTDLEGKEHEVIVACNGETIKFRTNASGHVVGKVTTKAAFDRLTKEIPEAYIEYKGGENVPTERVVAPADKEPDGQFILVNGANKLVLDDLSDDELREFAEKNALEVHPDLTGEALMRAIFNQCQTA